jgi:hypothetical protein
LAQPIRQGTQFNTLYYTFPLKDERKANTARSDQTKQMSGSVKKNQLKATIKIPGEQREKKCTAAHEKLNLNKTDRVNKLTAAQIDTLVSKKQEGVCLDFTSPCFQFENSEWLNDFPNVLKEYGVKLENYSY